MPLTVLPPTPPETPAAGCEHCDASIKQQPVDGAKLNALLDDVKARLSSDVFGNWRIEGAKLSNDTRHGSLGLIFSLVSELEAVKGIMDRQTMPNSDAPAPGGKRGGRSGNKMSDMIHTQIEQLVTTPIENLKSRCVALEVELKTVKKDKTALEKAQIEDRQMIQNLTSTLKKDKSFVQESTPSEDRWKIDHLSSRIETEHLAVLAVKKTQSEVSERLSDFTSKTNRRALALEDMQIEDDARINDLSSKLADHTIELGRIAQKPPTEAVRNPQNVPAPLSQVEAAQMNKIVAFATVQLGELEGWTHIKEELLQIGMRMRACGRGAVHQHFLVELLMTIATLEAQEAAISGSLKIMGLYLEAASQLFAKPCEKAKRHERLVRLKDYMESVRRKSTESGVLAAVTILEIIVKLLDQALSVE